MNLKHSLTGRFNNENIYDTTFPLKDYTDNLHRLKAKTWQYRDDKSVSKRTTCICNYSTRWVMYPLNSHQLIGQSQVSLITGQSIEIRL